MIKEDSGDPETPKHDLLGSPGSSLHKHECIIIRFSYRAIDRSEVTPYIIFNHI